MTEESDHTWESEQSLYDDENDFELSDESDNEGTLHFLDEFNDRHEFYSASQNVNEHDPHSAANHADDPFSIDHYTAKPKALLSYKQPPARQVKVSKTSEPADFDIFVDSDCPEPSPHGRSYYGSNLPALAPVPNYSMFPYQLPGLLAAVCRQRAAGGEWIPDDYHNVTLEERVLKYYEWTFMEDYHDIWLWADTEGLSRKWTKEQVSGLQHLLCVMRKICIYNARHHRQVGSEIMEPVSYIFQGEINRLGIENIVLTCSAPYIYRFTPTGEDAPRHRRSDFDAVDQRRIDRHFAEYWLQGEEENNSNEEKPRHTFLTKHQEWLAMANELEINDTTDVSMVRDYLDKDTWTAAMELRLKLILCPEVPLPPL